MKKTQFEYRNVDDLIPYVNNAKIHSDEQVTQVASSIREFGFLSPVVITDDNTILAGHCRVMASKKLGLKEVPCVVESHLTDAQRRAYILADNRISENSEWNMDLVKLELEQLNDLDFDIDLTGWDFDSVMDEYGNEETEQEEADEFPEPPITPVTKKGDLWTLGDHRLLCGDATSFEDADKLMRGGDIALYITDPPYNVSYVGKTKDALTIQNDSMEDGQFRQFLVDAFTVADSVMKDGGVFYIWHADLEGFNFRGACRDVGWQVRQCLIWAKNSFAMGRQDYQWKHEPCLYGWKAGAGHEWYSDRKQTTLLEFDKPLKNGDHPTMKPVELFAYQIGNSTRRGDIVLDSFGGSGTTLIACEQLKRKARLMELDPKYCDVIIRRWKNLTGQKAVRDDGVEFDELNT